MAAHIRPGRGAGGWVAFAPGDARCPRRARRVPFAPTSTRRWSSPEPPYPRADDSYRRPVGVILFSRGGHVDKLLLVGLGGALGSLLRYGVGGAIGRLKGGSTFPIETLLINVSGCLVIGLLAGLGEARGALSAPARAFLLVGLLGGFTTFSAFGYETLQLLRGGQWP